MQLLPTMWRSSEGQNQLRIQIYILSTKLVIVRPWPAPDRPLTRPLTGSGTLRT